MRVMLCLAALAAPLALTARAADNELTAAEKRQGYVLLFDGKDASGWIVKGGKPFPAKNVEDGALNPHNSGGGLVYTKDRFANFVLTCDFKVSPGCNSGIFFRVGDPRDEVQNGFEIQVFDSFGKKPDKHSCGALYDTLAPRTNASKPAGEWNHIEITADKAIIKVVLNGEPVIETDLDKYTDPGKNLDGSKNKYTKALKDFPREGHIGFQDHGKPVWFKNVKLKVLK
jgi:Domain of Unknown Function (DUF1080)